MNKLLVLLVIAVESGFAAGMENSFPAFFFGNDGQFNSEMSFIVNTPELWAGFARDSVTFRVHGNRTRLYFRGAAPQVTLEAAGQMAGTVNFLLGPDSTKWKTDVPTYRRLVYHHLYRGIDLTYSAAGPRIKSEFRVAPNADPGEIRLEYPDAGRLVVSRKDGLLVIGGGAELHELAPEIYQESKRGLVHVNGRYRLLNRHTIGFEIGSYDRSRPLIIDPVVSYATYFGGSGMGAVTGIAVDNSSNVYLSGWTEALDFPIDGALQAIDRGGVDSFVAKLSANGSSLLYASYIGGSSADSAAAIAVDSSGQAYVTGYTTSADFPLVLPIRSTLNGGRDAFVLKLNSAGSRLLYSTYFGGSNWDQGTAIAVDTSGNAYIAGDTQSADLPVSSAVQTSFGGQTDVFAAKFLPNGTISFCTYLGGSAAEHAGGIAVDSTGSVYVGGGTSSSNFPVANAVQGTNAGGQDGFITKIDPSGSTLAYSTYIGGSGGTLLLEQVNAVAVDSTGSAYIAGVTNSANFPVTSVAIRQFYNGMQDAFVTKMSASGALAYSTYLGGSTSNWASGIAVDQSENAYVTGNTSSLDFPTVNPVQATFRGAYDAIVSEINASGSALSFSTFYGGSGPDQANAIALDGEGNIYVAGETASSDFPLQGALQSTSHGSATGFVLSLTAPLAAPAVPSPVDGATEVSTNPVLNWVETGATSFDIYFGTSSTPAYVATTTATNYGPGMLAGGQTYYWRVVAKNGSTAMSSATWSFAVQAGTGAAILTIKMSHQGSFAAGQQNVQYLVSVSNATGATAASGAVTVTGTPPSGLTIVSMTGTGWNCSASACTRSDTLSGGASYPAITVTANIATTATSPLINAVNVSGGGASLASSSDPAVLTGALEFHPITPCRVVDTRTSQNKRGAFGPPFMTAFSERDFPLLSSGCGIPPTAQTYSLNVTVVPSGPLSFLSIWPADQSYPGASALNSQDGSTLSNAAIVPAGTDAGGSITVVTGNSSDLIIDVNGYFTPPPGGLLFYPVPECRVVDTRTSGTKTGADGPPSMAAYSTRDFPIASSCGVPSSAQAYSLNFTAVPPVPLSFLSTWPAGQSYPGASTLNSTNGNTISNSAIVPAGTDGAITVVTGNPTDLTIDVNGYFAPAGSGGLHFYPVTPCRLADTRATQGKIGAFGPPSLVANSNRDFPILGAGCNIPSTAQAYALNVTVAPSGPLNSLSLWPSGQTYPGLSTLSSPTGGVIASAAIVTAGANGAITVMAGNSTDLILDISGYFAP